MVTIRLPWPPSINGYWRSVGNRQILSAKAREFREIAVREIHRQISGAITIDYVVRLEMFLYPPDNRRRDVTNFDKGVLDALTYAKFWSDDSLVKRVEIEMCAPRKPGFVDLYVEQYFTN